MNQDSLGTLAVLPREVRDKISSYVVASLQPQHHDFASFFLRVLIPIIDWIPSGYWRDIINQPPMRLSRQLRREFLETFLRDNELVESVRYSYELDSLLHHLRPSVDIATHSRAVGVMIRSNLFNHNLGLRSHRHSCVADRPRWSSRCEKILRKWHDIHGIPLHKLFVAVEYVPHARPSYSSVPVPYKSSVEHDYLQPTIRVYVQSSERSLAALEASCTEMLRSIRQKLDDNLHLVEELEQVPDTDDTFIGRLKKAGYATQYRSEIDHANEKAIEMVSDLRSFHEDIIEQMIQFWQNEDEFEKFCLDEFFALAEAW